MIAVLICNQTIAQVGDTLEIQRTPEGNIRFARFAPNSERKIKHSVSFLKQSLNTNSHEDFIETSSSVDSFGNTHEKFQQYYKGIKVDGCVYAIHGKNGAIEVMNGNYKQVNIGSVTPSVNEATAIGIALSIINATTYKWQDSSMQNFIKIQKQDSNATYYPKGELVVINDPNNGSFKLAWKLIISCMNPNDEVQIYIDAQNGSKIASGSLLERTNFYPASFNTQYSNIQKATVDQTSSTNFRLREQRTTTNSNTVNVSTLNLQHGTNFTAAVDFTNNNSTFDASHWSAFSQDRPALDAHWATENILDFWSAVFKRNSLDGKGLAINNYVHYSSNLDNAYWDNTNLLMVYGDGDDVTFNSFTALDIPAHEMGHGVNHFTAKLGSVYQNQEQDALNEGLSDIWAACVTNWVNTNLGLTKSLWLVGSEIFVPSSGFDCERNMQNPKDTKAYEPGPDTYHGINWSSASEPHINSTVLTHWFYLVCQGGSGTNDIGNTYSVTGIGISNAEKIVYQAETNYIITGETYSDARNAMISAVRDLNNGAIGTCQEVAVTNAWYAVGVGAVYSPTFSISNGGSNICLNSNPTTYSIVNFPSGLGGSITWSTDANIVTQTSIGNSTTLKGISNGNVTL